jgi:streptogramin lyase
MVHHVRRRVLPLLSAASIMVGSIVAVPHAVLAATGDIVEFTIPTAASTPSAITTGADHNLWFTENVGNKIGKLTRDGLFTEYSPPTAVSAPCGITSGPDGNLWFTEHGPGKIGRLTPSGTFTEFPIPTLNSGPCAIAAGPDGNLWFGENSSGQIAKITPTGTVTTFATPTQGTIGGITAGPDGNVWYTVSTGSVLTGTSKIGRVTTTGAFAEFTLAPSSLATGIASGPDGNLWFADSSVFASKIGKITTAGTVTEVAVPLGGGMPVSVVAGPDGNLWYTDYSAAKIGRVTVGDTFTEYAVPTASSQPMGITEGPDGNIWFTENAGNKIGRLEIAPSVVLPAMANAAYGGYTTVAEIENTGSSPAIVGIQYFDSNGNAVGSGDINENLLTHTNWTVRQDDGHAFAAGLAGSAKVYSSQPLASFVNEFAPSATADATSYTGIDAVTGAGATLYAPTIVNNAYGGYSTGIGLVNAGNAPTDVIILYRDASGTLVKTQSVSALPAGAYQGLYSGDPALGLPDGFAGTATITSTITPLAAVVNETGPGGQFSSYDAVPAGSTTLYAPAALDNAYGGFDTGTAIQNTTATTATVTINYYDSIGAATTHAFVVPANGYVGVYQGTDLTVAGAYTAKVTSTGAIAVIVNETAPSATSAKQSTSYNTFSGGLMTAHLALVESSGSDGWSTGEGIMNIGPGQTSVKVNYFDANSGLTIGTQQTVVLPPNAFWGLYQPTGGLPAGDRATADVSVTGVIGAVAVIANESNSNSFMSYSGR